MAPTTPIILLAFANDADDPLRGLAEEHDQLQEILKIPQREGKCKVVAITAATPEKLIQKFQEYQHRIRIFHYAGHSNQDAIFLKKDYPGQAATQATNLAGFLALQEGLELVFLNSCLSMGQAEAYQQAGIPAVLATNVKINDAAAVNFAKVFYQGMAGGATISKAFEQTAQGMQTKHGKELRGISLPPLPGQGLPWQLFPPGTHHWRLPLVAKRLTKLPTLDLKKEFFGREEDLQRLSKKLENSTKVVLMNGLGGIGKTVLATAYTQTQQQHYDHIAWINRGEDLINSFALNGDLAETLGMPIEKDDPPEERFPRILHKLRNLPGNNLLVIDNAQQQVAQKEIFDLLPGQPNWRVLLTSRLDLPQFEPIRLDTLNEEAAKQLFRTHYQGSYTEAELDELLQEIGYHTLTIELLARLLSRLNNLMSISELTAIMQEKQLDDPDLQELIYSQHSGTERGIYLHLMKAFELTDLTEKETWLLKQFIVLPVEQYPVATLAELLDQKPLALNKSLNSLAGEGWLTKYEDSSFSIHRLIRRAIGYQLHVKFADAELIVKKLTQKMKVGTYTNIVTETSLWISYADSVASYFSQELNEPVAMLNEYIAVAYRGLGQHKESLSHNQKVLAIRKSILDANHPSIATSYGNIAVSYNDLGQNKKALRYQQKDLAIRKIVPNVDEESLAISYDNLAVTYHALGKYKKALGYHQKALVIKEALLDANHPNLAIAYNNIANTYQTIGKYKKALGYHQKALTIRETVLDNHHPDLSTSYHNIATTYRDLGQYEKALLYHQKDLAILELVLDANHPYIASSYTAIGNTYRALGKYEEALQYHKKDLAISEKTLDGMHPNLATSYNNIAATYGALGQYEKALNYHKKAIYIKEAVLDDRHPDLAESYNNIAVIFRAKGQAKKALSFYKKTLVILELVLDNTHPHLAVSYNNIALVYRDLGKDKKAKEYESKADAIIKRRKDQ